MHLRLSILLLVIIMDGLQVIDDHLCAIRQISCITLFTLTIFSKR